MKPMQIKINTNSKRHVPWPSIGTSNSETLDAADGVTLGNDIIFGYGGNDTIFGLAGDDIIDGQR